MDTPFHGAVFVFSTMTVSVLGLIVVRRFADVNWLKRQNEVASFFFLMVGTLYAVLIAFAIFVVWTQFQDAGTNLEHEANEVGDLSRMSMAMPDPLRGNIHTALINYLNVVMNDEFPAMADGRDSPRTWEVVQQLWDVYNDGEPQGLKVQIYYTESLKHLNELSNYRRIRLFTSRGTVPLTLWYLLYSGGVLLIVFTYFFGHESVRAQAGMTAALAGILAFSVYLIAAYDGPYSGATRVPPDPLKVELTHISVRGAM